MKVLLTGASSFTGFWFAKELSNQGHEVVCTMTQESIGAYDTHKNPPRIRELSKKYELVYGVEFGSPRFCAQLERKFDVVALHGAWMPDYKSPQFDVAESLRRNLWNAQEVFSLLAKSETAALLTGTYFEGGEGSRDQLETPPVSPYGLAKGLIRQAYGYYAEKSQVPLLNFVIPNPFGPQEDVKFTAHVMKTWQRREKMQIRTPLYVRDHMHVNLVSKSYVSLLSHAVIRQRKGSAVLRPSEYGESVGEFTGRMAREVRSRTNLPCEFELATQTDFPEPLSRLNTDVQAPLFPEFSESRAWDEWVQYYQEKM